MKRYFIFLVLFLGCVAKSVYYVDELPNIKSCKGMDACIKGFDIYILEEFKDEKGLLEHEKVHIRQKFADPFNHARKYKNDKEYRCPKFKRLLREWLSLPFSKIRVRDIFEAIGLCMTVNVSYKAAFMNYGPPHTGKTQFFNIIKYVIGIKNMSALTLQRITKNEFGTVGLQFKLLNYCSDLGSKRIWDTSIFKNLRLPCEKA